MQKTFNPPNLSGTTSRPAKQRSSKPERNAQKVPLFTFLQNPCRIIADFFRTLKPTCAFAQTKSPLTA
jgi:hypothetical protein